DLLALALRIGPSLLARVEVEGLDEFIASALVDPAAQPSEQVDRLAAGQPRPQFHVAGDIGQAAVQTHRTRPWVLAEEADRSRIMGQDAQQDPDRRRLAGAVGAEEAVDLAAGDLEIEPVESADSAIGLHDLAHRDRRRDGCASLVCAGAGQCAHGSSSPGGGSSVSSGGTVSNTPC